MKYLFAGVDKPELFKHIYSDTWSRRIDLEHRRLVYRVRRDRIDFLQARYYYLNKYIIYIYYQLNR